MKFYVYTLGCKVNTYESEVIKDEFKNNGYIEDKNADIFVINTCTVTNKADSKSKKLIRQVRRENPHAILIVCGCFVQNKNEHNIEEADIIIGNKDKSKIITLLNKYLEEKKQLIDVNNIQNIKFEKMSLNNFDKTRAFIKIQDGCNNFCTYCIIPYVRGNVRSKEKEDVLKEVKKLVDAGHKEIVLTGIHTGNYGSEFKNYDFASLLNDLVKIKNLERIRISSIEITEINDRVLDIIKNNKVLVNHMHIPLQSGSDKILKLMNRKYDTKYFIEKINKLREIRKDISITTDVIVGFPNETDELFKETIETIKKIKFSKLHVFPYSKRTGTKASLMEGQVDDTTKKERVKELLKLSKQLEIEYMNKFIGKKLQFIPEKYKDGYLIGHTGNYLLIKSRGDEKLLHTLVDIQISSLNYPYLESKILDKVSSK